MQTGAAIHGLPLRSNFLWTAGGNIVYAICQWGMIVSIAKLTNASMVGQFALGIAISTPILRLANLQLRNVQASDAKGDYTFDDYLSLRLLTTIAGLAAIGIIAFWQMGSPGTAWVVLAVGAAKSIEAVSSIFYGLFQAHDRMDQVGLSLMIKGAVSVASLLAGLYLTRHVFWGVLALALGWLMVLLFFDARRSYRFLCARMEEIEKAAKRSWIQIVKPRFDFTRQRSLARVAFPLGIVMGLMSLNLHMPRYFIHYQMGEKELGIFSAIGYMNVSIITLADALGHAATARLSRMYAERKLAAFARLTLMLVGTSAVLAAGGIGVVALGGEYILALAYGQEYSAYLDLFLWVMAGGGAAALASLLTSAITATRSFRLQIPLFASTAGVNALACYWLIPAFGLIGAAAATVISTLTHAILAAGALILLLKSARSLLYFDREDRRRDHVEASGGSAAGESRGAGARAHALVLREAKGQL